MLYVCFFFVLFDANLVSCKFVVLHNSRSSIGYMRIARRTVARASISEKIQKLPVILKPHVTGSVIKFIGLPPPDLTSMNSRAPAAACRTGQ